MGKIIYHLIRFWLLIICAFISANANAAYLFTGPTTPYTWVDISATGTNVALGDDVISGLINIGFTFNYGGVNYTQLRIASNGMLYFNAAGGNAGSWWTNVAVNNATQTGTYGISNAMMPYWTDLNPNSVATRIKYQTLGTAPNRQFVVSFLGVPTFSATGSNTFQVVLYENGRFQYNYQSTNTQGGGADPEGATIGYHVSGTDFVQFSLNTASVPNFRTLTWYIAPSLVHLKSVVVISDPFNGVTNPKNIPGAVARYTLNVSNTSNGVVDANTTSITDPIPTNTELFTGGLSATPPFTFTNGTPSSGLTCSFISLSSATDCIEFSNNGGATWSYTPSAATDYDSAITHIRFRPTGFLNGDTLPVAAPYPNFSLSFSVRIK